MAFFAGIDIGASTTKVVLFDRDVFSSHSIPSGGNYREAAKRVITGVLAKAGLSFEEIASIVTTGYGASSTPFLGKQVTEISCQGRGINYLAPTVRTIIDLGDQATRVIRVSGAGKPTDFVVSEKCAAGSGRFLQIIAKVLGIGLDDLGPLSLKAKNAVKFSTGCAVFAESETISRIAEGTAKEEILAGVHEAMASKVQSLLERVKLEQDCALTGGGAKNIGLIKSIETKIGIGLLLPPEPQLTAALGAALIARDDHEYIESR